MKKIMFNDKYHLTQAVLEGRKTMTRRIVPIAIYNQTDWKEVEEGDFEDLVDGDGYYQDIRNCGKYYVGEVIAIAQAYKELDKILTERKWKRTDDKLDKYYRARQFGRVCDTNAGWNNKMFVKSDLMPHHIKITAVKVERLQDISDEDCLREGIYPIKSEDVPQIDETGVIYYTFSGVTGIWTTPRKAFAALIDKVSGKGTWQSNPWVFVYEFELVK